MYFDNGAVQKCIAGSRSTIASWSGYGATQRVRLTVTGTTIEGFINDVSVGTVVDATLSGGAPGIFLVGGQVDDWEGEGEITPDISVVADGGVVSAGANGPDTSTDINTTGAVLLEATALCWSGTPSISDSKGNDWNAHTTITVGSIKIVKWYAYCFQAGKSGTGHNFTLDGSNIWGSLFVRAYSATLGYLKFETTNGGTTSSGTSLSAGSITPSNVPALVTSGIVFDAAFSALAVSGGTLAIFAQNAYNASSNMGGGVANEIQTGTAAARNPAWTWTTTRAAAACSACYLATATAPLASATISQLVVEAAEDLGAADSVQVSQLVIEAAQLATSSGVQFSQLVIEAAQEQASSGIQVSQLVIEVASPPKYGETAIIIFD